MNIHIKDTALFDQLQQTTLAQVEVGSPVYGLQDQESDRDMLCLYFPFHNQQFSFVQTHHQLQYKDEAARIDYLFVDVFSFVRNTLSGDSTLNFEALHCESLLQTPLHFLHSSRYYFYNYSIIKSYLGFANRDLKQYWQQPNDREAVKKYIHAERGYRFAQQVMAGQIQLKNADLLEKKQLFSDSSGTDRKQLLNQLQADIDNFRKNKVNPAMEAGQLVRYMLPQHQQLVDAGLYQLRETAQYLRACNQKMMMEVFYEVNENGILYP